MSGLAHIFKGQLRDLCSRFDAVLYARRDSERNYISAEVQDEDAPNNRRIWIDLIRVDGEKVEEYRPATDMTEKHVRSLVYDWPTITLPDYPDQQAEIRQENVVRALVEFVNRTLQETAENSWEEALSRMEVAEALLGSQQATLRARVLAERLKRRENG